MCHNCRAVPGHEYMVGWLSECQAVPANECLQIALSVFATKNDDRFPLTYRKFANVSVRAPCWLLPNTPQMLLAIEFEPHATMVGYLCPPKNRFRAFERGNTAFCFNPVSQSTSQS